MFVITIAPSNPHIQPQPSTSVMLDHLDPSAEMALALRREAAMQQPMVGGVEIAPRVFATPTNSDFGSNYTMSEYPGYYSSQQPDDDYRVRMYVSLYSRGCYGNHIHDIYSTHITSRVH